MDHSDFIVPNSGGELFQRVIDCAETLSEWDVAHQYVKQICQACSYLSSKRVAHLDIKPENVMCADESQNCLVKVFRYFVHPIIRKFTDIAYNRYIISSLRKCLIICSKFAILACGLWVCEKTQFQR